MKPHTRVNQVFIKKLRDWCLSTTHGAVVKDGNLTYHIHPDTQARSTCECNEPLKPILRDDNIHTLVCSKCESSAFLYRVTVNEDCRVTLGFGDGTTEHKWRGGKE